ncbi:MAG: hypothetical protein U1E22_02490 [Coriobacteriia bacterium]|nr:hypothetical protein [Coriobacteriia bacterium]
MDAEGVDDFVDFASFDGGIDDAEGAFGAGGFEGVVEDGAQEGAVCRGGLEFSSSDFVVEVAGGDEVGFDDDAVAGGDEVTEGVPFGGAGAGVIEAEGSEEGLDGFVDGVGRVEGGRLVVGETGLSEASNAMIGVVGHGGPWEPWLEEAWAKQGSNARGGSWADDRMALFLGCHFRVAIWRRVGLLGIELHTYDVWGG